MLTTIGVILLTIAVTFVAILIFFKFGLSWYFKRVMKQAVTPALAQALAMAAAPQGVVARITMELEKLDFSDPRVYQVIEELKALGYASSGRYSVPEMLGMKVWAGTHPKDGSLALVLEHNDRLFCSDLARFYDNGAATGAGTNPIFHAEHYPSHIQYRPFPAGTPMKEIAQWLAARPLQSAIIPATSKNLRMLNTRICADMMDYQLSQPVPVFAAWKDMAVKDAVTLGQPSPELTEQQWQAGYDMYRSSRETATEEAMKDHLLRSGEVSALEWNAIQDDVVFVHDRLDAKTVAARALRLSGWTEDEPPVESLMRKNLSHDALFEAIQALLPPDERFCYLATVSKPLAARAYRPVKNET